MKKTPERLNMKTFYRLHTKYAVTITPSDTYQFNKKVDRLTKFINIMNEKFIHYPSIGIHYKFYIELSEPGEVYESKGPRLHLHGWVEFKSHRAIKQWLLYEIYNISVYAHFKIGPITDMTIWDKYCTKQQHIIKESPLSNFVILDND